MGVRSDALRLLASERLHFFLTELLRELAMRGRGHYRGATDTPEEAVSALRCINELVLVVATQLSMETMRLYRELRSAEPYPDETLVLVLEERAEFGGSTNDFRIAVMQAVAASRPGAEDDQQSTDQTPSS